MAENLAHLLQQNAYPGRGIVLGLAPSGTHAFMAYFIMGRSENSRNRVFTETGNELFTEAADAAKVEDPRLILYRAVQRVGESTIVANGTHGDTVAAALAAGEDLARALRRYTFEPDAPVFTPRIAGVLQKGDAGFSYQLALAKSEGAGQSVQRFLYEYPQPQPGMGHFLHTYASPKGGLPPFYGEPVPVLIESDIDAFGESLWHSLHTENKVSLFVRALSLGGDEESRIYNQYQKV